MNQKNITPHHIKAYLELNNIKLEKNIEISKNFNEDDLICSAINFLHGFHNFYFNANEDDVKNYSGKNGYYLIKKRKCLI